VQSGVSGSQRFCLFRLLDLDHLPGSGFPMLSLFSLVYPDSGLNLNSDRRTNISAFHFGTPARYNVHLILHHVYTKLSASRTPSDRRSPFYARVIFQGSKN
jgi:hypothetical protein